MSVTPAGQPDPMAMFAEMRLDAAELLRAAQRAAAMFRDSAPLSFGSLSDLLDEVLPAEPIAQARIARALEFDPEVLARLRNHTVDPLRVPKVPLANLGQMLDLDADIFWFLIAADHARFSAGKIGARGQARGTTPEQEFREAWEQARRDDPNYLEG